jgi:hypothetical protein
MKKYFNKLYCLIALLLVCIVSVTSLSYAMFVFNDKDAELEGTKTTSNLVNFSNVDSDYYRIYFFASPLYATGANLNADTDAKINTISSTDEQDPKKIADSTSNPYNDTSTDYWIPNTQNTNSTQSTIMKTSSSYAYVPLKNVSAKAVTNIVTPYKKADFTGYIRENTSNNANLTIEKTYTYFSMVVEGQVTASQLNAIVATSEYKDVWGYGPEFIGWTYDKEAVASRIRYSSTARCQSMTDNYTFDSTSTDETTGYNTGSFTYSYNTSNTKYAIGNYGRTTDIKLFTDSTSLQYIDNYSSSSSSSSSIDGSKVGDKVIYLYPVFGAKQTSGLSSYHNLIKFRRNPGSAPQTLQSDEIDYTQNRLTRYFLFNGYDSSNLANPDYSISDYYLDFSGNTVNRIDINVNGSGSKSSYTQSSAGYQSEWPTIISDTALKKLGLETGYYDIRLSIWYASNSSVTDATSVFKSYYESNYYDAIMYSHSSSGSSTSKVTINGNSVPCPYIYYQAFGGYNFYYVIGFHKQNEHHLTGDNLNGNISSYSASGFRRLPLSAYTSTTNSLGYFFVENVELYKDEKFTILDSQPSGDDYKNITYTTAALSDTYISDFNSYLTSSYNANKDPYYSITTGGSPISITTSDNSKSFTSSKDGTYSFLFTVTYAENDSNSAINVDGSYGGGILSGNNISSINIAYKEVPAKYKFIVLSDPSQRHLSLTTTCPHSEYTYIYDDTYHWAVCKECGRLWTEEMNYKIVYVTDDEGNPVYETEKVYVTDDKGNPVQAKDSDGNLLYNEYTTDEQKYVEDENGDYVFISDSYYVKNDNDEYIVAGEGYWEKSDAKDYTFYTVETDSDGNITSATKVSSFKYYKLVVEQVAHKDPIYVTTTETVKDENGNPVQQTKQVEKENTCWDCDQDNNHNDDDDDNTSPTKTHSHTNEIPHQYEDGSDTCHVCGYKKGNSPFYNNAYFNSYNIMFNYDSYVCSGTYDADTIITMDTIISTLNGGETILELFEDYWGDELVDISTGLVFNFRTFLSRKFKLNRNYVCYIRRSSTKITTPNPGKTSTSSNSTDSSN